MYACLSRGLDKRAKGCSARSFLSSGPLRHPPLSLSLSCRPSRPIHAYRCYKPHRGRSTTPCACGHLLARSPRKRALLDGWLRLMPRMRLFACFARVSKYRFLLPTLPRREIELLSYDTMMIFTKQTRVSERSR